MRVLITGICGFVGSTIALNWREHYPEDTVFGFDWLGRRGSELNLGTLREREIRVIHADLRSASDFETLPHADLIIDAAANPSVLAGVDGKTSSRQLLEHNLVGTVNLLEYAKIHQAAFILLSTSRVYSVPALRAIPLRVKDDAFALDNAIPEHVTSGGITEDFTTSSPLSLYGATKLASETLALEYGDAFGFPVWINRCGVMAGGRQFPRPDQGIFAYWIHSWATGRPLRYLGFGGLGHQVRDCLHPRDLVGILRAQAIYRDGDRERILNLSGGIDSARSLRQLSNWCRQRFGHHDVIEDGGDRAYDLPWVVLDSERASQLWNWRPTTSVDAILEEIAVHATTHPLWIDLSA
jgi:CDP-paratose 2-epimerase